VDVATLVAAMPGLSTAKATSYLPPMEAAMREFDITSEMRSRMWLAQCGHESGSLVYFEEIASGAAYEGRKDLGNTQPGDGKKYKGRGPIQITGRYNYTDAQAGMGIPLVDRPEMAADPFGAAFRISAWWWKKYGLNEISDKGDVLAATKRINGGTNGLSDRQKRYDIAKGLGAKVIVGPGPDGTQARIVPGFLVITSGGTDYQLIFDGPKSYWRSLPAGAAATVPASMKVKDDGSLLTMWKRVAN
jgi:predicted chitinase